MRHTDEDDTAHLPLTRPSIAQLIGTDSQLSFSSATFGVCKNILSLLHVISGAVTYVSLHLKQQNCCWGYTIKSHDVGETWRMSVKQHGRNTHLFNGPFSGTMQVSRYQKGKTNLDFAEARDSEWQWHQLGHMQVCT